MCATAGWRQPAGAMARGLRTHVAGVDPRSEGPQKHLELYDRSTMSLRGLFRRCWCRSSRESRQGHREKREGHGDGCSGNVDT